MLETYHETSGNESRCVRFLGPKWSENQDTYGTLLILFRRKWSHLHYQMSSNSGRSSYLNAHHFQQLFNYINYCINFGQNELQQSNQHAQSQKCFVSGSSCFASFYQATLAGTADWHFSSWVFSTLAQRNSFTRLPSFHCTRVFRKVYCIVP